ncbi:hypothetical protein JZU48_00060, partial [bacterium]|nr:hypothetical protein [bacterium]
GRRTMVALRGEWSSMTSCEGERVAVDRRRRGEGEGEGGGEPPIPDDYRDVVVDANDGDGLASFVGNVIVRSVLSERVPGSMHLSRGFLDALSD